MILVSIFSPLFCRNAFDTAPSSSSHMRLLRFIWTAYICFSEKAHRARLIIDSNWRMLHEGVFISSVSILIALRWETFTVSWPLIGIITRPVALYIHLSLNAMVFDILQALETLHPNTWHLLNQLSSLQSSPRVHLIDTRLRRSIRLVLLLLTRQPQISMIIIRRLIRIISGRHTRTLRSSIKRRRQRTTLNVMYIM